MDKRSVIAIAFTFLVLFLWQALYIAPKQKELARKRALEQARAESLAALEQIEEEQVPEAATYEDTTPEPRAEEVLAEDVTEGFLGLPGEVEEVTVTVITERMRVLLNSRGGEIRSVKLFDYVKKDGELVELVPESTGGGFAISLLERDEWRSLSGIDFTTTIDGVSVENNTEISLSDGREQVTVTFSRGTDDELVEKSFTLQRDGYEVTLDVTIKRGGNLRFTEAYSVAWECGMAVTEKDEGGDRRQFAALGKVGEENYQQAMRKFSKSAQRVHEGTVVWAGSRTKYFLSALIPEKQRSGTLSMFGDKTEGFIGYSIGYPFRGDPRLVEDTYRCYLGPLDMKVLKSYQVGLEKTIDLGKLRFLSVLVLNLMLAIKRFIPNYGVIIIILSILTKVLFYRLTHKSFKSMKDMQRLQPKIKELQEKFKDDKEKMNKEMMRLYKEAGVNPLGGCLPLLLQMPVFFALYNVFRNTIELRGAPFALWINDLSSPDVLFSFGVSLPILGSEFHLLPILMGGAMILQSKLGGSPTGGAAPAAQAKMMTTMMPIIFTVFFYRVPSGLVLYWLINTVFSVIQQYYIHQGVEAEERSSKVQESTGTEKEPVPAPKPEVKVSSAARRSKGGSKKKSKKSKRRSYH